MNSYTELRKINVNSHTEKKGQLTYLSWAWAVDTLLQHDPSATWEWPEPKHYGDTVMVFCNVTAFGKTMKMQLPVMDNRNNAMSNPDSRKISDASMRCLAKCIACFGIGLYIYAGEDLPTGEMDGVLVDFLAAIEAASDLEELKGIYMKAVAACPKDKAAINDATNAKKAVLK